MKLSVRVESLDDIDEKYQDLYTERDGEFVLTGIEGMKTQDDIDRLQTSLRKERADHRETKAKLKPFQGIDSEGLQDKLDRLEELSGIVDDDGNITDDKIEKLVDRRSQTRINRIQRELDTATSSLKEMEQQVQNYQMQERQRTIRSEISKAIDANEGFLTAAREDALIIGTNLFELSEDGAVVAKEGTSLAQGLTPKDWMADMREQRPYWWGDSVGGGSRPGKEPFSGSNPWSKEGWNITEQAKLIMQNRAKAEKLAGAAGSRIGAISPSAS